jgi:amino acid adenylation domain-containing protein/thioester reductase-like protein/non-ribosomal peptide synthase protein (TIGR01720 family)
LPNGNVDILGRVDFQVKIRGFRIELGEIEAAIGRYDGVKSCVVVAQEVLGTMRLVAYYSALAPVDARALSRYLESSLLSHMVPAHMIHMQSLPMNANGKIDRSALPAVQIGEGLDSRQAEDMNPTEKILQKLFAEVLALPSVGLDDNFFEFGGDSLLCIRVVSLAKKQGLTFRVKQIFAHLTIRKLAASLGASDSVQVDVVHSAAPFALISHLKGVILGRYGNDVVDAYPLTPLQQGMLFHHLQSPSSQTYLNQISWRFSDSEFDRSRFFQAWKPLVQRHVILRTQFGWEDLPEPVQIVKRDIEIPRRDLDLSDGSLDSVDDVIKAVLLHERQAGVDFSQAPLMKFAVIKLPQRETAVIWTYHHILLDGWSLGVLLNELISLYGGETLPESASSFGSYVSWMSEQQKRFSGEASAYWKEYLGGFETPTPLPATRSTLMQSAASSSGSVLYNIPKEDADTILSFAKRSGVTPGTVLQAAWALVLSVNSRETDVVFGSPVAGRSADVAGVENLVGMLINSLPIRVKLHPSQSIGDWLQSIQASASDSRQYEWFPLTTIQSESSLGRGSPIYDTIAVFENLPSASYKPSKFAESLSNMHAVANVTTALSVSCTEKPHGLEVGISFDSSKYPSKSAVSSLAQQLHLALSSIASAPSSSAVGSLNISSPADADAYTLANNFSEEWRRSTVDTIFSDQALRTPDSIAVVDGDEMISFSQLDDRSSRLASWLLAAGVRPGSVVAVRMYRSLHLAVALIAILKAGCAYVPIEPMYPAERQQFMLEDSGAVLLVTLSEVIVDAPALSSQIPVVAIDKIAIQAQPVTSDYLALAKMRMDPAANLMPLNVIYTSGSTGRPKGVVVTHEDVAMRVTHWHNRHSFNSLDRCFQRTSLNFDFTVWELWLPFMFGLPCIFLPSKEERELATIIQTSDRQQITRLSIVPSMLEAFVGFPDAEQLCSPLKSLFVGGEPITDAQKPLFATHPMWSARLVNVYGPTETTMVVTTWERSRLDSSPDLSLGSVLANSKVYVVDDSLNPVPSGVTGEIVIGGYGLAQGYLDRKSMTAEKFCPDPFGSSPLVCSRMYRTGDLGYMLPSGNFQYAGRTDFQIKIRGMRIELGEIESAIASDPRVKANLVTAIDANGSKRLVAYVVPTVSGLDTASLRTDLVQRLPAHMIPTYFMVMNAFPLNAAGKVDRKALPLPSLEDRSNTSDGYVPPRSPVEKKIASVWEQVLKVPRVDLRDNFFELGGDSIIAIQVVSQLRQLRIDSSVRLLFSHPTIASLASNCKILADNLSSANAEQGIVSGSLALSSIQRWFFDDVQTDNRDFFHQAFLLDFNVRLHPQRLNRIIRELLVHHDALRMRSKEGTLSLAGEDALAEVPCTTFIVSAVAEMQQVIQSQMRAINMREGPCARFALFELGSKQHLFASIHHLAVDGVSWRILFEDLATLIQQVQIEERELVSLPLKSSSIQMVNTTLQQISQIDALRKDAVEWRKILGSATQSIRSRAEWPLFADLVHEWMELSQEVSTTINFSLPSRFRANLNEIFVSALSAAVSQTTASPSVLISLESHGREDEWVSQLAGRRIDSSRTVGWFTSMFPVAVTCSSSYDAATHLKKTKSALRNLPSHGISFGLCRSQLADMTREISTSSEILFNFLGGFDSASSRSGDKAPFQLSSVSVGDQIDPSTRLPSALTITGVLTDGRLHFDAMFCPSLLNLDVAECMSRFKANLIALAAEGDGALSPSDFKLIAGSVSQSQLDQVLKNLGWPDEEIEAIYPLTSMQQGMLFHTLAKPELEEYITQVRWSLSPDTDIAILKASIRALMRRHAIFRTVFAWEGLNSPVQIVRTSSEVPIDVVDRETVGELLKFEHSLRTRPLRLSSSPGVIWSIVPMEDTIEVIFTHHHIYLDGWSLSVMLDELRSIYASRASVSDSLLPSPVPFENYVSWSMKQDADASDSFWRHQLGGFKSPTALPLCKTTPDSTRTKHVGKVVQTLAEADTSTLISWCRSHGVTINSLLQTAWGSVLSLHAGEKDVLFGATVSGRSASDLADLGAERLVGLTINTLPVRVSLRDGESNINSVRRVHETFAQSSEYETSSLSRTQQFSDVPRGTPLFETLLVYENYPAASDSDPRPTQSELIIIGGAAYERTNLPLSVSFGLSGSGSAMLQMLFDPSFYEESSVETLMQQFVHAMTWLSSNPTSAIGEMWASTSSLLNANQECGLPQIGVITSLLERSHSSSPDSVALVEGDEHVSFVELHRRASQVQSFLLACNCLPETHIAVCMGRSIDYVVTIVGILLASCTYVPVDPQYPISRQRYMIDDSHSALIITESDLVGKLFADSDVPAVSFDQVMIGAVAKPTQPSPIHPQMLAYVIYTSGSTGRPKGVAVPHVGASNYLQWQANDIVQRTSHRIDGHRILCKTSICFDVAVWELFVPLGWGGCLVLAPSGTEGDALDLANRIAKQGVTVAHFVPSMFNLFVEAEGSSLLAQCQSLEYIVAGGEALSAKIASKCVEVLPKASVTNSYGPTEASIGVSAHVFNSARDQTSVPIGIPINNTHLYVLSKDTLNIMPVGSSGELFMSGINLARCYLNRPGLTADRFIPNPFASSEPSSRMYASGDLCRVVRIDNKEEVEYIRRLDFQVKVRGFRIELGEIESALQRFPHINQAAVIVSSEKDRALILAYVVAPRDATVASADIKEFLQSELPSYMVPHYITVLDALPTTSTGKLDRNALPRPESPAALGDDSDMVVTPLEEKIMEIWKSVLGIQTVGPLDGFFDLGGDSISMMRVATQAKQLGISISVGDIASSGTIRALAAKLSHSTVEDTAYLAQLTLVQKDIEMIEEYELLAAPAPSAAEPTAQATIFLTGATGFLGAHLLAPLLASFPSHRVRCLIRGDSKRLEETLTHFRIVLSPADWRRVECVSGDLENMDTSSLQSLAEGVDLVLHCGAAVNALMPYSKARKANVLGTHQLLQLRALAGSQVPFINISTLSVLQGSPNAAALRFSEQSPVPEDAEQILSMGGYAGSKFVAELLVKSAALSQNFPARSFRVGTVVGSSTTGAANSAALVHKLITESVALKAFPDVQDHNGLPWTPVDFAADAIVALSRELSGYSTVNISNPLGLSACSLPAVARAVVAIRPETKLVPIQSWAAALRAAESNQLGTFADGFANGYPDAPDIDTSLLVQLLEKTNVKCPPLDEAFLKRMCEFLISSK